MVVLSFRSSGVYLLLLTFGRTIYKPHDLASSKVISNPNKGQSVLSRKLRDYSDHAPMAVAGLPRMLPFVDYRKHARKLVDNTVSKYSLLNQCSEDAYSLHKFFGKR